MAVVNEITSTLPKEFPQNSISETGLEERVCQKLVSVAAADDDNSIYVLGVLPAEAILTDLVIDTPGITGATDYNIGIYDVDGTEYDDNEFADALDLSSDAVLDGMAGHAHANRLKPFWELAGHVNKALPAVGETQKKAQYVIAAKGVTVGTAAGSFTSTIRYGTQ